MRTQANLIAIILFWSLSFFSQEETKTYLLNKDEFKRIITKNNLVEDAIRYAFGSPNKQNPYKLDIQKVLAYNESTPEFDYSLSKVPDDKKETFHKSIYDIKENTPVKLKVVFNPSNSSINDNIKKYVKKNNSFILNLVVVGDARTFVKEPRDQVEFFELLDEKTLAEKACRSFWGDSKKNKYHLDIEKMSGCFKKNALSTSCEEKHELVSATENEYREFNNKITSAEYSSGYVLFDLQINRSKSIIIPEIENVMYKRKDGSEHIKFYFVIPKDNVRSKIKKELDLEGKLVNVNRNPVTGVDIYLRDYQNLVISTSRTNEKGEYQFKKIKEGSDYNLFIEGQSSSENALYLTTMSDIMIAQFNKTALGFEYKLLNADIKYLSGVEEIDPSMDFIKTVQGRMLQVDEKIGPLAKQEIALKDDKDQIIQSQETDENGNFVFKNLNPKTEYTFELPKYSASEKVKIYLANLKNEFITEFKKDKNNKFSYKVLSADVKRLEYMNEEDVELEFKREKNNIYHQITIQEFIYYNLNSYNISNDSKPVLNKVAKIMLENPEFKLEITSHTDSRGEDAENMKLSLKRSEAVIDYLATQKLDKKRTKALGMGESKPLNSCLDGVNCLEEEYKMNRRTEFRFYK